MQEAGDFNIDVKIQIQNELMSINTVVTKIKQELREINSMVQSNGSLDTALTNAIDSLVSLAEETGVVVRELAPSSELQEDNPMANALSRISAGYITEKLKELSHN